MKIFADLHHTDLFYSLQLLFEKRLGAELYRPIGLEWFHAGYWKIFPHINTAGQYLCDCPNNTTGIQIIPPYRHNPAIAHRGITLQAFKDTKFDIIIASIPQHLEVYKILLKTYQPQAKLIFQAGNNWGRVNTKNLLTSARGCSSSVAGANTIYYHQEFSLEEFFPSLCSNPKSIVNLQHYSSSIPQLQALAAKLPGWNISYYGAGNEHGPLNNAIEISSKLRDTGFVWHVKKEDEGYGYNIHHSFACGKPMIVGHGYQKNFTAGDLYIPNVTVLDLLTLGVDGVAKKLIDIVNNYPKWSNRVYSQFQQVVNFDEEEIQIRKFLERLL